MIGDRMDTDVKSGLEAGMRSILVLTGSTQVDEIPQFPYRPTAVLDGIADVVPLVERLTPHEAEELEED
jgi:NagD protein